MARLKTDVSEFTFQDLATGQQLTLHGGDEVPRWAWESYNNPRIIEFDEGELQ